MARATFGTWRASTSRGRQRLVVGARQHEDLEQIAGAIRSDDQPSVRIFTGIFDSERMVDGGSDVLVGDTVLSRRVVNPHQP